MKNTIVFASNNKGKLEEVRGILTEYNVLSLKECNAYIDVTEDEDTFKGNALKKAKEIYNVVKIPVIADDSGLCIDVLNNWPGVMTHRFLGDNKSDDERNDAIINKMGNYSNEERTARVICDIVYFDGNKEIICEGIIKGKIPTQKRGINGFGFDPIFELDNGKTLAELTSDDKNKVSARRKALEQLKEKM